MIISRDELSLGLFFLGMNFLVMSYTIGEIPSGETPGVETSVDRITGGVGFLEIGFRRSVTETLIFLL